MELTNNDSGIDWGDEMSRPPGGTFVGAIAGFFAIAWKGNKGSLAGLPPAV
jgi:hypothetical protein